MADLRAALLSAATHTSKNRSPQDRKAVQDALRDVRAAIGELFPGHETKHSEGQVIPADIPWVSIHARSALNPDPKSGFYLVYLVSKEGTHVNLCLGIGTDSAGGAGAITARAALLRSMAEAPEGAVSTPQLDSEAQRATDYAAGTAYCYVYDAAAMPDAEELITDLTEMVTRLDSAADSGLRFQPGAEPLHIFYPWVEERGGPGIVKTRKALADERGASWWVTNTNVGQAKVQQLAGQIASGIPTFVYLYASGDSWRARLLAITDDEKQVLAEPDLLAPGYPPVPGRLAMKLAEFQPMPPEWRGEGLYRSNNGHLVAESVQGRPAFTYVHSSRPEDHSEAVQSAATSTRVLSGAATHSDAATVESQLQALSLLSGIELYLLSEMHAVLQSNLPQLVLAGPPGTGKTWLARHLAAIGSERCEPSSVVQFHPSYAYEDFIEGLRPTTQDNQVVFENQPGHLLQLVSGLVDGGPDTLIIDELNRANIPSVFGELLYLLEYRDQSIRLRLSGDFRLPSAVRFIATMNTADRSVRSMDAALRRRFEIFELPPSVAALNNFYRTEGVNEVPDLAAGFELLNTRLSEAIDRHHGIGHSFFMRSTMNPLVLRAVWERKVRPLIEEYFFDEPHRVESEFSFTALWPSQES